jgi:hypothetical protein
MLGHGLKAHFEVQRGVLTALAVDSKDGGRAPLPGTYVKVYAQVPSVRSIHLRLFPHATDLVLMWLTELSIVVVQSECSAMYPIQLQCACWSMLVWQYMLLL